MIWKGGSRKDEISAEDVELVNWQRLAGGWGIRIFTKDGDLKRFAGFKDAERQRLANFFKETYDLDMLDRELSVKGWNWGTANFHGTVLGFEVGKSDAFEIPLTYVNQCIPGKNEVTMEFHHNDEASVMLTEMRFHIPPSESAGDDPVENFKENVLKSASVVVSSGDAIAIFREIHCLSPRGRYDIKVFPTYIHLHGKTFDYKVMHSSVMRLFLLPHKDQRQMHFAVNVDPPVKQGQTRYHYLVFNFKLEDDVDIELPFDEDELEKKFAGKLEKEISGPVYEVISKVLKGLTGKKVTMPVNFVGHSGTPAIACSHKAASGFLYPLERGFIFIYKPSIYIRFDEVRYVHLERSGSSTRSFDVTVTTSHDIAHTFSSIEKGEYGRLYDFLKAKKLNLKVSGSGKSGGLVFDEQQKDHHLEKIKADAIEDESNEDTMSSDDSDFNPDALEALSAKEEYDSEPSTTSSEGESSEGLEDTPEAHKRRADRRKKRQERLDKKQRKRDAAASGSGSTEKKRVKKKTRLPGQPKRPMSAYFIWMNENREKIKSANPGMSITEVGKKAGELWKAMADKSEWDKRAAEDKQRYDAEMKKWLAEGGKEQLERAKKAARQEKRKTEKKAKESSDKSKASSSSKVVDPKGGSGTGFKSKEFIEDSTSSSDEDNKSKKPSKASKAKKAEPKPSTSKQKSSSSNSSNSSVSSSSSSSDAEMKSASSD